MSELVMAMSTLPGDFEATSLAQDLVGSGLAACVSIQPGVRSVYTWKGVPQVDEEQQLLIKILVIPVIDGSEDYLRWVERSVGPKSES
jgi:periplasmic divalent cation tolerance protein